MLKSSSTRLIVVLLQNSWAVFLETPSFCKKYSTSLSTPALKTSPLVKQLTMCGLTLRINAAEIWPIEHLVLLSCPSIRKWHHHCHAHQSALPDFVRLVLFMIVATAERLLNSETLLSISVRSAYQDFGT
jgi:hypothetical protein